MSASEHRNNGVFSLGHTEHGWPNHFISQLFSQWAGRERSWNISSRDSMCTCRMIAMHIHSVGTVWLVCIQMCHTWLNALRDSTIWKIYNFIDLFTYLFSFTSFIHVIIVISFARDSFVEFYQKTSIWNVQTERRGRQPTKNIDVTTSAKDSRNQSRRSLLSAEPQGTDCSMR